MKDPHESEPANIAENWPFKEIRTWSPVASMSYTRTCSYENVEFQKNLNCFARV